MGDCIVTYCTAQWKQFFIYLFFIYTSICTAKQNILPAHVIKHIHVAGQFVGVQFGLFPMHNVLIILLLGFQSAHFHAEFQMFPALKHTWSNLSAW